MKKGRSVGGRMEYGRKEDVGGKECGGDKDMKRLPPGGRQSRFIV